jgi:hypothetical protein
MAIGQAECYKLDKYDQVIKRLQSLKTLIDTILCASYIRTDVAWPRTELCPNTSIINQNYHKLKMYVLQLTAEHPSLATWDRVAYHGLLHNGVAD